MLEGKLPLIKNQLKKEKNTDLKKAQKQVGTNIMKRKYQKYLVLNHQS